MIARVSDLRLDPAQIDDGVRRVREDLIPVFGRLDGAVRARWMVSPETGDVLAITVWADEDAMYAAATALASVRDDVVGELHATPRATQVHDVQTIREAGNGAQVTDAWTRVLRIDRARGNATAPDIANAVAGTVDVVEEEHLADWWSIDTFTGTGLRMATWADRTRASEPTGDAALHRWLEEALGWTVSSVDVYLTIDAVFAAGAIAEPDQASSSTS